MIDIVSNIVFDIKAVYGFGLDVTTCQSLLALKCSMTSFKKVVLPWAALATSQIMYLLHIFIMFNGFMIRYLLYYGHKNKSAGPVIVTCPAPLRPSHCLYLSVQATQSLR